jgi:hypothetical protein
MTFEALAEGYGFGDWEGFEELFDAEDAEEKREDAEDCSVMSMMSVRLAG